MTKEECVALLYRYTEYDGMGIPNLAGCREAMKMAADLLSQPFLPSDLDEAAEEYGRKEYSHAIHFWDEGLSKNKPEVMKEDFVNAFKADAKWMAGQGVTFETIMQEDEVDELVPTCPDMYNHGYCRGDKLSFESKETLTRRNPKRERRWI